MILRPEIAARVFDTPLLMHPGKLDAALAAIGHRIVEGGVILDGAGERVEHVAFENGRPLAGRIGDRTGRRYDANGAPLFEVIDGVALIPIEGTLVHKGAYVGAYVGAYSGRTSYEGLQAQVLRAMRNPAVKAAVFEVDSFGGELAGAFETADMIARLSVEKPTLAILTDHALSAGYLLASAARQIIMPEHGRAGSIGVVRLHADWSAALERQGVRVTVLRAGAQKIAANPFEALPEASAHRIISDLEAARATFAQSVGRYRGSRFTAEAALATEAQDYRGRQAVTLGLADATGHALEAFDGFVRAITRGRAAL
jgi:ClpP class serine protease